MTPPTCPTHQRVLICPACIGKRGGAVTSPKKAKAARKNGKLGGAPAK
jgi:hypothetical protein